MATSQDEMNAIFFVRNATEYYIAARSSMQAQLFVSGNIFHHAVESFLKAGLAKQGKSLRSLKQLGHNLRKLWGEYKASHPKANLHHHDKTISGLDDFEEIRYPNDARGSIGVGLQWSGVPPTITTRGGLGSHKQYVLTVDAIDDLVADIMKASSWNAPIIIRGNKTALAALRRNNKRSRLLTKKPPLRFIVG